MKVRSLRALSFLLIGILLSCNSSDFTNSQAASKAAGQVVPSAATPQISDVSVFTSESAVDRILEHIRVLSVEIGSRVTTTAKERYAANYIASHLEAAGYLVDSETFDVESTRDESTVTIPNTTELISARAMDGSLDDRVSGILISGALERSIDISNIDAKGVILLLDRGIITFAEKALNAESAGAIAVIIVNNIPGPILSGTLGTATVSIPVVSVSEDDGEKLNRIIDDANGITVRAKRRTLYESSQNVVGRDWDHCEAYLGAHYDSVRDSPGANDNASGAAIMLELAVRHRGNGLCVIAFGAEEAELLGSQAFVRDHKIRDASFMLNLDMLGKIINPKFVVLDMDPAARDLAERASAVAKSEGLQMPPGTFPPFSSSDHVSFSAVGVPSITVHSGADTLMHSPEDDFANISSDDLETMLRVTSAVLTELLSN